MLVLVALHAGMAATLPWWGRRLGRGVWFAAALPPLAAVVWASVQAPGVLGGSPVEHHLAWAPSLGLSLDVRLDALSLLMVWIVSGVGAVVLAYSAYYYPERDAGREAALLLAFAGAMVGLVVADNLFALYVFWELTTVVSFLLIAGRGRHRERRRAAEQALLMTAVGGLAMLLGFVMLGQAAGSYRISEIVAEPPRGGTVPVAVVLILIGVFAKSAQMPLHGWLPAAMVAPTPVSAYLHAAAMVKAGVYLVARLAPGFAEVEPWRPMVLTVGLLSMVLGAWRALRETDLKMLLAYGTVSELGMLLALLGAGTRTAALAGAVMLPAHAAFKATLFLVTGILEHRTGTRDLRELSGVGRAMPGVFAVAALAAASMANLPPLIAFLGKEAAYEAFLHGGGSGGGIGGHGFVAAGLFLGSVLTVAYTARFLWGAFARKPGPEPATEAPPAAGLLAPPALLAAAGLLLGLWYKATAVPLSAYADSYPAGPDGPYKLALWHGLNPVLGLSVLTIVLGAVLHLGDRGRVSGGTSPWKRLPRLPGTQGGYRRVVRGAELLALRVARHTQVGSLPAYLAVLLLTVLVLPGTALALAAPSFDRPRLWTSAAELAPALVVLTAAVAVTRTRHRLTGVLLAGAVGYGVAGLFLVRGAPDLALTQFLVESLTLVVIVLVLRRMPPRFTPARSTLPIRCLQVTVAVAIGAFVGLFAMAASSARRAEPVSRGHLERVEEAGAHNAVNAIIVDFRALDTLAEISVLLVTVLGAVSLVRIWRGSEPAAGRDEAGGPGGPEDPGGREPGAVHDPGGPGIHPSVFPAAEWDAPREGWLPGAGERPGGERSVLLEVVTRVFFPSLLVLSLYLLLSGHSHPGGGFAAGLVAGLAYVLRYLVGGRADLASAAPVDPAVVAGGGLAVAALVGGLPMAFGAEPLASTVVSAQLPVIGTLKFATSLFFDIGVYLLVIGIALKLLSALGVALSPDESERAAEERELS